MDPLNDGWHKHRPPRRPPTLFGLVVLVAAAVFVIAAILALRGEQIVVEGAGHIR